MSGDKRRAAITGIGQSQVGRRLERDGLSLTLEATLEALANAGLRREDIDGLACWPGQMAAPPGMSPTHIFEVRDALNLRLNWYSGGSEGPGQLASILNACLAVSTGQARHVLCFRTLTESTAIHRLRTAQPPAVNERITGPLQWQMAMNAFSATSWVGLFAQRHFHEHGTLREQMAQIALNARRNAQLNPKAVYQTPLTLDDYMNARMISTPLCLYDCDVPVDGATAIIVSAANAVADSSSQPIWIDTICGTLKGPSGWDQFEDLTLMAYKDCGAHLWSQTDYRPKDVDVALLYDGFSYLTMAWLESLGFCGRGESGDFIEGGQRIALDGDLPLNTHGGQLSAGRLHGFGHLHEAVLQLRGLAGARQVTRRDPRVAVVANGGGPLASAALLVRD